MRIGIDLDGPCYPFHDDVVEVGGELLGRELSYPRTWDFYEEWGLTEQEFCDLLEDGLYQYGLWSNLSPRSGCLDSLEWLRDLGHEVIIVTHRSLPTLQDDLRFITYEWLAYHRVPHDDLIITKKKGGLGLDLLLDDNPRNLRDAGAAAVAFDFPWNRGVEVPVRVGGWPAFCDLILELDRGAV